MARKEVIDDALLAAKRLEKKKIVSVCELKSMDEEFLEENDDLKDRFLSE